MNYSGRKPGLRAGVDVDVIVLSSNIFLTWVIDIEDLFCSRFAISATAWSNCVLLTFVKIAGGACGSVDET